ncbi:peptidylprolyl isomerase [Haliovirga abyssi]|uniref:peptidylprolyl isomerase n=1 Tax=Haliovirga abyssi TaxID=2996794 RepID=A0AAU9DN53_9FUSO|nr:peptidylprolyl isomerase [Haliovirga abyssi]BDU51492.1 peptidylprolyl isomerase [Haliovirga abyssi]
MKKVVVSMLILAALVGGCNNPTANATKSKKAGNAVNVKKDNSKVLKKIGNDVITENDLKAEMDSIPAQYKAYYDNEKGRQQILDRLVEEKILKDVAIKQGLENDPEFVADLEKQKGRLLASYAVKRNVLDKVKATDAELKKEYEKNKEKYKQEGQVKARHILIKTTSKMTKDELAKAKAKAEKILKEALAGKTDFAELAKKYSEGPSGKTGGELGWFTKKKMVKSFADAAFKGEKGKVYPELVKSQFGYHIIQVEDKKAEGYKPFEEVKKSLEDKVSNDMRRTEYTKWIDNLKKEYLGVKKDEKTAKSSQTKTKK